MKLNKKLKYGLFLISGISTIIIPTSISLISCSSNNLDNYIENLSNQQEAPININQDQYNKLYNLILAENINSKSTKIYNFFSHINNYSNSTTINFDNVTQEELFNYFLFNLNKNSVVNYYQRGGLDNYNYQETNKTKEFVSINNFNYDSTEKLVNLDITFSSEYYFQKLSKDGYDPSIIYDWTESYFISYTLKIANLKIMSINTSDTNQNIYCDPNYENTHINYESLTFKLDYNKYFSAIREEYNNLLKGNHIQQDAYDKKMQEINSNENLVSQLNNYLGNFDNILSLNPGNNAEKSFYKLYGDNTDAPFITPCNTSITNNISQIKNLLPGIGYKLNENKCDFYSTYFSLNSIWYVIEKDENLTLL